MDTDMLAGLIDDHRQEKERCRRLYDYYAGKHAILERARKGPWSPNNRLVCNFARYITDTAVGYVFGSPVRYQLKGGGEPLGKALFDADVATQDVRLAKDMSVCGKAYELAYVSEGKIKLAALSPESAFVVRDGTVERKAIAAVVYGEGKKGGVKCRVYGADTTVEYSGDSLLRLKKTGEEAHLFGRVPVVEYLNNDEGTSDYEQVLTLIDAYNTLQSDRLNDKERFVDSILLIQGCQLPDDEAAMRMLDGRILELPYENADARYLTKTMNEADTEILRASLMEDIHKFSQTPDFSDRNFAGNSTGVAIKYKLLSLENLAVIKERFFIQSVKRRVWFFERYLRMTGVLPHDTVDLLEDVRFNRILPVNELETAKTIEALKGILPDDELMRMWK